MTFILIIYNNHNCDIYIVCNIQTIEQCGILELQKPDVYRNEISIKLKKIHAF